MKSDRQSAILEIISEEVIETQQQLQEALARRGIQCTQSTLSRDIKDLHLVKCREETGKLRYAADTPSPKPIQMRKLTHISQQGILSFRVAENLILIKTLPGLASGVGSYIDQLQLEDLAGTLAGNDTVLLAMTSSKAAQELYHQLQAVLFLS